MKRRYNKRTSVLLGLTLTGMLAVMLVMFAGCGSETAEVDTNDDPTASVEVADSLSFKTADLDGKEISSEDLFAQSSVTMVNIWGTFCGPCIEEMPEIEKIHQEYGKKGVAVVGLVSDVTQKENALLGDALDIIQQTGVTYQNLYWDDVLEEQIALMAVPTTIFVDGKGNLIGEPIVGAAPDQYREMLDQCLEEVGETE